MRAFHTLSMFIVTTIIATSYATATRAPSDCIWSFNTISRRVHKRASGSEIFNGRFPEKYFVVGKRIFFFDSNGDFKRSIALRDNQKVGISERGEVIFVRDDIPIAHEGVKGPVEMYDSDGNLLCSTIFPTISFDCLIELDNGAKYFRDWPRYHAHFYDSNLVWMRNFPGYYVFDFAVVERKKLMILLASICGSIRPSEDRSLICTDYEGHIQWSKKISGNWDRLLPRLRATDDNIVLSYDDASSNTWLDVFDANGELIRETSVPFSPLITSDIVGDSFAMLERSAGLRIHIYSVKTSQSHVLEVPSKDILSPQCYYTIQMFDEGRLMLCSRCGDRWQYLYYDDQHRLADSLIVRRRRDQIFVRERYEPILLVENNRIMIFEIWKRGICLRAH